MRGWHLAARLVILLAMSVILPLTWLSLRAFNVPERHELVAGAFMTTAYALIASAVASIIAP